MVIGNVKDMDRALGHAADEFQLSSKDWKNAVHLGVNLNKTRHQGGEGERGFPAGTKAFETGKQENRGLTGYGNLNIRSGTS